MYNYNDHINKICGSPGPLTPPYTSLMNLLEPPFRNVIGASSVTPIWKLEGNMSSLHRRPPSTPLAP